MSKSQYIPVETLRNNLDHGRQNLMSIYAQATQAEIAEGLDWYNKAQRFASYLSDTYGIDHDVAIDVIAVVSPKCEWGINQVSAETLVRHYVTGGYVPDVNRRLVAGEKFDVISQDVPLKLQSLGPNNLKALWIMQGYRDMLSGEKVESFAHNIRHCEDPDYVTVDSHAVCAWLGWTQTGTYKFDYQFYAAIKADYTWCANQLGMLPLQFQAVIWIVKKRLSAQK